MYLPLSNFFVLAFNCSINGPILGKPNLTHKISGEQLLNDNYFPFNAPNYFLALSLRIQFILNIM